MRVPYWYHAHNLYLQIALEQGMPGLLAFLGMTLPLLSNVVNTYRNAGPYSRWFCLATIAALLASLSYGLLDAELYATPMVLVMFLPIGFALALHWALINRQSMSAEIPQFCHSAPVVGGAGVMPILALIVLCTWPGTWEKFYTNLGVLTQTKAELSLYRWPIWPIQDELRRQGAVDLSVAIAYYGSALALDPNNATAHRRLGQIALSQGNYPLALDHLNQAYKVEPGRQSIHRLLGEVYAVTGDVARATMLWQSIHIVSGQIDDRLWWYGYLDAQQKVQWIQQTLTGVQLQRQLSIHWANEQASTVKETLSLVTPRSQHEALVLTLYKTA
jgi:tetratricopeptide (TPR) repeat protein